MNSDLQHVAWVLVHNVLEPEKGFGGCSCDICSGLRSEMERIRKKEADEWYQTAYKKGPK